jgi:hypothetical protein
MGTRRNRDGSGPCHFNRRAQIGAASRFIKAGFETVETREDLRRDCLCRAGRVLPPANELALEGPASIAPGQTQLENRAFAWAFPSRFTWNIRAPVLGRTVKIAPPIGEQAGYWTRAVISSGAEAPQYALTPLGLLAGRRTEFEHRAIV